MNGNVASTDSHIAMRNERRTCRTACRRAPSSAAMTGAQAPTSPDIAHIITE